jgi:hypothetical protein
MYYSIILGNFQKRGNPRVPPPFCINIPAHYFQLRKNNAIVVYWPLPSYQSIL